MIRRTGNGEEFLATDVAQEAEKKSLIRNFLLAYNRLPTKEEFDLEMRFIQDKGRYASRARLTLNARSKFEVGSSKVETPVGELDPSLVKNYGMSGKEETEITQRSAVIAAEAKQSQVEEEKLETKHLETLTQKTFRRLLGRDPAETGSPSELSQMTSKLRSLNSQSRFEDFLKKSYNLSGGKTEHQRRREEIQGIIGSVHESLRIWFGFTSGTLDSKLETLLKLLRQDPAFETRELSREDLDQIRTRLESLIEEDIHFGSSAASALLELLKKHNLSPLPTLADLTAFALFSDILTGVVSREFQGSLQFSAYTLKLLASSFGLKLSGLKLTLDELKKLTDNGFPVLVSIEERHFVLVTKVTDTSVELIENGILRTKTRAEFQSRWFGIGLVKEDGVSNLQLSAYNLKLKTLSTQDLLKVKGAGWFKKLFKKIAKIFLVVVAAVFFGVLVAVVALGLAFGKQIAKGIMKVSTALFGKTIGRAIGSVLAFPFSFLGNTAHLIGQGDVKGLFKYWGQSALQIAMTALMFIPGVGQALYGALQFVFQPLLAIGKFLVGGALQVLGVTFSGMGQFIGSFSQGLGGFFKGVGGSLRSFGQSLVQSAKNFFNTGIKDIFANLKSQTFSLKKLWDQTLRSFKDQFNPVTYYQNLWKGVTRTFHDLARNTGFQKLITTTLEKVSLQIAQSQIDKSLEKSKMNSFLKGILSSVSSAGIQAVGKSISQGIISPILNQITESLGLRGPPANSPGILRYDPRDEARYLTGADGKTREIYFGGEAIDFNRPFEQGRGVTFGYSTDENGIPSFARFFGTGFGGKIPEIQYGVDSRNPDKISFQTDSGDLYESTRDLSTGRYRGPQRISNLPEIRLPSGSLQPFNPKDPNFDFVKFLKDRYGLDGGALPKLGALLRDAFKADKLRQASTALEGGVEFALGKGNSGQLLAVKGQEWARQIVGIPGTVYSPTNPAVAKFIRAGASLKDYALKSRSGFGPTAILTAFDSISTGIQQGHLAGEIAIDTGVDLFIAGTAGATAALIGGALGGATLNPAVALVVTATLSTTFTIFGDQFIGKPLKSFFKESLLSSQRKNQLTLSRDEEIIAEMIRRDFSKRYAFIF